MPGSEEYTIKNLIATIVLCTTLSTLSFTGRLWGRSLSAVRLGWDDFFMASAVVCMLHLLPLRSSALLLRCKRAFIADAAAVRRLGSFSRQYRWWVPALDQKLDRSSNEAERQVYASVLVAMKKIFPRRTSRTGQS